MRRSSPWLLPLVAALGVAIAVRLWLPFDGLYGQDAFAYFRYARALGPHFSGGAPLPALYWPIGYPVTVALFLPLTGGNPAAGQIVSALACAWAAAATGLLVRDLESLDGKPGEDPWPAVLAGLTVAVSGAVLRSSQVVMSDGLGLGAAAAALFCGVRYAKDRHGPWLVAAALSLAWGASARWMVGLLALPLGVFVLLHAWAPRHLDATDVGRGPSAGLRHRPRLWPWALAATLAGLAALAPALAVARSVPLSLAQHEFLLGWSLRNVFARDVHMAEGHAVYRLPIGVFYLARLGWPDYFFPAHALLSLAGAWALVRERRWATSALLLGWPAVVWLFVSGIPFESPRFLLPTLPAIGALLGIGLASLRRRVSARTGSKLTILVACAQLAGLVMGAREHARLVARKNDDRDLVAWAAERMGLDAKLLIAGPSLAFQYYASITGRDLLWASSDEVAALVASGSPVFVLADVNELETQWPGLNPERRFAALSRDPGLAVIGTHPPYTLFRVRSDASGTTPRARIEPGPP
jgi:hypothetical protein